MNSKDSADMLDFDRDVPATHEDIQALRRVRLMSAMDTKTYLRFLESMPQTPLSTLRAKRGPQGTEPFEL